MIGHKREMKRNVFHVYLFNLKIEKQQQWDKKNYKIFYKENI